MFKVFKLMALFVGLVLLATPALGDMRGRSVCGLAADEAVVLTWQLPNGAWRAHTPSGLRLSSSQTETGVLAEWRAAYVCDVTIEHPIGVGAKNYQAKLYRLNRKMHEFRETADSVFGGESDGRIFIVGTPSPSSSEPKETRFSPTIYRERGSRPQTQHQCLEVRWGRPSSSTRYVEIWNECAYDVEVAFCLPRETNAMRCGDVDWRDTPFYYGVWTLVVGKTADSLLNPAVDARTNEVFIAACRKGGASGGIDTGSIASDGSYACLP